MSFIYNLRAFTYRLQLQAVLFPPCSSRSYVSCFSCIPFNGEKERERQRADVSLDTDHNYNKNMKNLHFYIHSFQNVSAWWFSALLYKYASHLKTVSCFPTQLVKMNSFAFSWLLEHNSAHTLFQWPLIRKFFSHSFFP